jgi:hypothetical protein
MVGALSVLLAVPEEHPARRIALRMAAVAAAPLDVFHVFMECSCYLVVECER